MATIEVKRTTEETPATDHIAGLFEEIRNRAFGLFKVRGFQTGHEMEDWLEAERQTLDEAFAKTDEKLIAAPDGRASVPTTLEVAAVAVGVGTPP